MQINIRMKLLILSALATGALTSKIRFTTKQILNTSASQKVVLQPCPSGYALAPSGVDCYDVDECATAEMGGKRACVPKANGGACVNTRGSFTCGCAPGYYGDGIAGCGNVNECETMQKPCGPHSQCLDAVGSFVCTCKPGYYDGAASLGPGVNGAACVSNRTIEVGSFQKVGGLSWQTVYFTAEFAKVPVIVVTVPLASSRELIARVRSITKVSFEVAISFPGSTNATEDASFAEWIQVNLLAAKVNFIAVVPGKQVLPDGTVIQAGLKKPAGQMLVRKSCTEKKPTSWETVQFENYKKGTPVLLAQIQDTHIQSWQAWESWNGGGLRTEFCRAGIMAGNDNSSMMLSRICTWPAIFGIYDGIERLGWIAIGSGDSNFTKAGATRDNEKDGANTMVKFSGFLRKRLALDNSQRNKTVENSAKFTHSRIGKDDSTTYGQNFTFANPPIVLAQPVTTEEVVTGWMAFRGGLPDRATYKFEDDEDAICPYQLRKWKNQYINMLAVEIPFSI